MGRIAQLARLTAAQFIPGAGRQAQCSGCGVRMGEGVRLVSGPAVYLCGDCIGRAATQLAPRQPPPDAVRCRFCRCLRPLADVTSVASVTVCADCLGVLVGVLAETPPSRPAT